MKACGKVYVCTCVGCALVTLDVYKILIVPHTHAHTHSQGSYGRLGLGNSDSQSTLKPLTTFPSGTMIKRMASSRGSDGHSLAITMEGGVYSWGDGEGRERANFGVM